MKCPRCNGDGFKIVPVKNLAKLPLRTGPEKATLMVNKFIMNKQIILSRKNMVGPTYVVPDYVVGITHCSCQGATQ